MIDMKLEKFRNRLDKAMVDTDSLAYEFFGTGAYWTKNQIFNGTNLVVDVDTLKKFYAESFKKFGGIK